MDPSQRAHVRVSLDDSFRVTFEHQGRQFRSIPMTNLSVGGFGMRLPSPAAEGMTKDDELHEVQLEHADLPQLKVIGRVAFMLGQRGGESESLFLIGVQFRDPPKPFTHFLETFVERRVEKG